MLTCISLLERRINYNELSAWQPPIGEWKDVYEERIKALEERSREELQTSGSERGGANGNSQAYEEARDPLEGRTRTREELPF